MDNYAGDIGELLLHCIKQMLWLAVLPSVPSFHSPSRCGDFPASISTLWKKSKLSKIVIITAVLAKY